MKFSNYQFACLCCMICEMTTTTGAVFFNINLLLVLFNYSNRIYLNLTIYSLIFFFGVFKGLLLKYKIDFIILDRTQSLKRYKRNTYLFLD